LFIRNQIKTQTGLPAVKRVIPLMQPVPNGKSVTSLQDAE